MGHILELLRIKFSDSGKIPLFSMSVSAGKPIPIEDDIEMEIDLNEFLVEHPAATFFARFRSNNESFAGISDGDILIIDTAIEPKDGKIVVVGYGNEITLKIYRIINGEEFFESYDGKLITRQIEPLIELRLLGVVTKVIHSL